MTYTKQLEDFKNYMNACVNVMMRTDVNNGALYDMFCASDFKITFRGESVTLAMGADVFQAVEEIIQREIDENGGF